MALTADDIAAALLELQQEQDKLLAEHIKKLPALPQAEAKSLP